MSEQAGPERASGGQGVHGSEPGDDAPERHEPDVDTWTEETETGGEAAS